MKFVRAMQAVVMIAGVVVGVRCACTQRALGQIFSTPAQPAAAELGHARFQALPLNTPSYRSCFYSVCPDPNAGYLSGAADVIIDRSQFLISTSQSDLLNQQANQVKMETRRKGLDEYLYERNVLPAPEDERERSRVENLRRSRNRPPRSEIWSGKVLNELLNDIQQQLALKVLGPELPISQDVVRHLNVSAGSTSASIGLFRDQGRLRWPPVFLLDDFSDLRQRLDQLAQTAYQQAAVGPVSNATLEALTQGVSDLDLQLKGSVNDVTADDYLKAKRYLRELRSALKALRDPKVGRYITGGWAPQGTNVSDLVKLMTRGGLKFAPAIDGDEEGYLTLHRAFVEYIDAPASARRWDTSGK